MNIRGMSDEAQYQIRFHKLTHNHKNMGQAINCIVQEFIDLKNKLSSTGRTVDVLIKEWSDMKKEKED